MKLATHFYQQQCRTKRRNEWTICNRPENNGKTQIQFNYRNKTQKYKTKQTRTTKYYIRLKTDE